MIGGIRKIRNGLRNWKKRSCRAGKRGKLVEQVRPLGSFSIDFTALHYIYYAKLTRNGPIERARSISPTKDSPLSSTPSSIQRIQNISTQHQVSPTPSIMTRERLASRLDLVPSEEPSKENNRSVQSPDVEPVKPLPPISSLSRSGTMSWQQRPSSRGSGSNTPKSRPLSVATKENTSVLSAKEPPGTAIPSVEDLTISQKAKSLENKDPAWFKQTADRGIGSVAYRKGGGGSSPAMVGASVRLPGLSRESSTEPERGYKMAPQTSSTISRNGSTRGSTNSSQELTSTQPSSTSKSPLPLLSSQRFEPPLEKSTYNEAVPSRSPAMSPSQGRLSPERMERPVSPTKGLGGFVQSAMLKRSDSVNKRWSAQTTPGLSRGNSTTGNRTSHDVSKPFIAGIGSSSGFDSKAGIPNRETSPGAKSRPGSSHSTSTITQNPTMATTPKGELEQITKSDDFIKPALPDQSRSHFPYSQSERSQIANDSAQGAPLSPSKAAEAKRWSPTKASWLESAINKPDSPKPNPATPQQPGWMADLKKSKQTRGSVDLGKPAAHKEVSIGGFLRSPTMSITSKPLGLGDITEVLQSQSGESASATERLSSPSKDLKSSIEGEHTSPLVEKTSTSISSISDGSSPTVTQSSRTEVAKNVPKSHLSATRGDSDERILAVNKPKPATPPKKDFRSSLKTRQVSSEKGQSNEPEFKNIFGKLKRTETKNYVAPDELKDNILRGKAGLALTGGPKRSERRDDFKDSILQKKEEMKTMGGGSIRGKPPIKPPGEPNILEAIAKRRGLGARTSSASAPPSQDTEDSLSSQKTVDEEGLIQVIPEKKASAPARLQQPAGSSASLANRFNPTLAGILARGPSPMAESIAPPPPSSSPIEMNSPLAGLKGPQLIHATKSRARGPKRRLPTSLQAEDGKPHASQTFQDVVPEGVKASSGTKPISTSLSLSTTNMVSDHNKPRSSPEPEPPVKRVQPEALKASSQSNTKHIPSFAPKSPSASRSIDVLSGANPPSVSDAPSSESPVGLGIISPVANSNKHPTIKSPRSPPIPAKKSEALSRIVSNGSLAPHSPPLTPASPVPKASRAPTLFTEFFDDEPNSKGKVDIDTQAILHKPIDTAVKIKTLRKEIWEISGERKKTPIPPQQEHILYEDCMYLCSHVFGTSSGKRTTEVYLWCGDGVSASSIEDAQLFCRNAAKDVGGKLILLSQGKESSMFFEALGGIVITRRGSSSASSATYMLCGRRHMGQIAFDEVDFSPKSLCSGFPFIVAATGGSLYLWKGKGASADELGCARLIGMDLGLTGEIEEIDEGSEPSSFWQAFRTSDRPGQMAEYWPLKAASDKFATRLFSVDIDIRPKSSSGFMWGRRTSTPSTEDSLNAQVKEISPYSQPDLSKDGVFVLDAYFEIYVYVSKDPATTHNIFPPLLPVYHQHFSSYDELSSQPYTCMTNQSSKTAS